MTIPEEWIVKYEKAKKVYAQLRRPDGSLPGYGDTGGGKDSLGPSVANMNVNGQSEIINYQTNWMPEQSFTLYPIAGYSIWWDGLDNWPDEQKLRQTTVVWSYFHGQAHKHTDEMSVLLYAGGQTWLTNAGYWTYGTKGRSEAESWDGSNAPHLVGESTNSERKTELRNYAWSDDLAFIDLERRGPQDYIARRQVIYLKPNLWIILDHTDGDMNTRTKTTWTAPSGVILKRGKFPDSFYLQKDGNNLSLESFFITSHKTRIDHYKGSLKPFAGWVDDKPSDALVIEQPANNSWSVAIWSFGNPFAFPVHATGKPYMQNLENPESWEIILPVQSDHLSIRREGNSVYIDEAHKTHSIHEVKLKEAPTGIADNYNAIRTAYMNAANKYPQFKNLIHYRWKMTYFLLFILVVQEVFFIIYRKSKGKHYAGLRLSCIFGWISVIVLWQVIVHLNG